MHYRIAVNAVICFTIVAIDESDALAQARALLSESGEILDYPGLPESFGEIAPDADLSIENVWEGEGDAPSLRLVETEAFTYPEPPEDISPSQAEDPTA